ncbi:helix-turn-helix domain-containing protein [Sphingopyxis sp.]|uniref:helix-turn-helix domain-containing protein n=1 Tax=Sphingopyxis sp. TaxID=1908224 RepID=UPI0025EE647C|nr:helix-turn-helix domain-containing protein [Sphingopyxis sp.]MBK6413362.1 helix-turn-helix domain-containing protein [Sphingopyxis sp.]
MTEWPLDWQGLVDEAVRRRKEEGHTQKSLAALAGVSMPTVNAFEQGDIKLRLEKVFDILSALGMVVLPSVPGSFAAFVRAARKRWADLVEPLLAAHPARQPLGHVSYAYEIGQGDIEQPLGMLRRALQSLPPTSGWSPFRVPTMDAIRPVIRDALIECWIGNPDADRVFGDAAHSDFWQVTGDLKAYLQRGYQEDGAGNLEPGTIFDLTLPVWRTAEVFVHVLNLAKALGLDPQTKLRFESRYTGLEGRELLSWAAPLRRWPIAEIHRSRTKAVTLTTSTSVAELLNDFGDVVRRTLEPLYDLFDGFDATPQFVESELAEFRKSALQTQFR